MSLIRRRGGGRRKVAATLTTAGALLAFQALAVIGAAPAFAVSGCTYNPATDTINVTVAPGEDASLAVENDAAANLDGESSTGAILFSASDVGGGLHDYENGANSTQCGSASIANTVAVIVLGQPSADENFEIDELSGGTFPASIAWAVDLGSQTSADEFSVLLNGDQDNTIVATDTSFDLNGAKGELVGVEIWDIDGDAGDDTIDASAVTIATDRLHGHGGVDVIMPGTADDPDVDGGGDAGDKLSYAGRTTCTVIDNAAGTAGEDANCDGDNADAGDEVDTIDGFDTLQTGSGNDTLIGAGGVDETFIPGDGDDDITGNAADDDVLDWSSSSAAMTIDPANGTASGQGTDTFTDVFSYVGSDFDDVLLWDGTTVFFSGGDGTDTVDASASTTSEVIDLDDLDGTPLTGVGAPVDDLENAIGGSANDLLFGNDRQNRLEGRDGDDELEGDACSVATATTPTRVGPAPTP